MRNSIDHSVRFGETVDRGMEPETVFPFIYTMIPFENDTWELVKSPATVANLTGIGPAVGPGARVQHPVNLEPDYMFKLISIKYTIYSRKARLATFDYIWYDTPAAYFPEFYDYQTPINTPLVRSLRATVSFQGSDNRILYGGQNMDAQINLGGDRLPLPIVSAQGYDYGAGSYKIPYLLPRSSTIMFELTNTHSTLTFYVGAAIYGMKVRL